MNKNDPNNETKEPTATMNIITFISEMVCVKPAVSEQQGRALSPTLFSSPVCPQLKFYPITANANVLSLKINRDALLLADSGKRASPFNFCL